MKCRKYLQFAVIVDVFFCRLVERVVNLHNGCLISTPVAVIGSREHCHDHSIVLPLISFHYQLMRPGNEAETVNVRELLSNVLAKGVAGSPW